MNSRMDDPVSHNTTYDYDDDPQRHDQNVGIEIGHIEEQHGEKKSVLKKVKAKAKKIKDSIKEHVGHGHDHDEDDDDELDMDPETHGAHTAQHVMPGHEGATRRHTHTHTSEPHFGERTADEGTRSKPSAYHTFDPSNATHTPGPGHEETLGWSTDTGRSKEQPNAPKNTPAAMLSGGGHSTGDLDKGKKGPPVKLGTVGGPTGVEEDPQGPVYQVRVIDSTGTGLHRTEKEEMIQSPKSKFQGDFQTFDPSTTRYVPGHEDTLDWSRTDTGRPHRPEELSDVSKHTPIAAHPAGQSFMPGQHRSKPGERAAVEGALDDPKDLLQGDRVTFAQTTASYAPAQDENMNWFGSDTGILNESGYDPTAAQSYMSGIQRRSKLGEDTAMEGMIDAPGSNLPGDSLTFVPTTTNYVPGQDENWGWPGNDTGRPNRLEELSNASKNTPIAADTDRTHHMGADEERGTGKLGGLHENTGQILDTDPNSPRGLGERRRGIGGEEVGVTPIMQLDKMNIYDEPHQNPRVGDAHLRRRRSPEDENIFTGSHDQFSPEPITTETNTFFQDTSPDSERSHNLSSDQKEESYTEKISSTAAMMADKAKQATNTVTSKLGYGDSSDQHSGISSGTNEKSSEPIGYGEKISNVTSAITDKAVQAKDVVANKLGYGGNQGGQHHEKRDPMYGKVATVGLKMQDSGAEPEVHSSSNTEMDKGVSMKEYLAEKLRPGEEDKALSDVITGALPLHKRKEDVGKVGEEGKGDKVTIIGRVTESEEVARQFGRGEETNYDDAGTGMASPGKGVLDRLKDAASFWFQKGTEIPSQDDMVEGNEGSPVISSMESEQKKEQKRDGGSGLQK